MLEEEVGYRFTFRHRFDASSGTWSGKEFAGLIPKRAFLPDAYHPERREVVEFLGNYYHGFPVEHPRRLGSTYRLAASLCVVLPPKYKYVFLSSTRNSFCFKA